MITTKTINHNGREFVVSELTVGQIDQVLGAARLDGPLKKYYQAVDPWLSPEMVTLSTELSVDEQANMGMEELDQIAEAVKEVNSRFLSRIGKEEKKDDDDKGDGK